MIFCRFVSAIEILEHYGDSTTQQICSELTALTKINWNRCAFASSDPITILFEYSWTDSNRAAQRCNAADEVQVLYVDRSIKPLFESNAKILNFIRNLN